MTRLTTIVLVLLAACRSVQSQPASVDADGFVLGNVQFVLLHELAHLVIDEKQIPILGSEEHAADYIAAMMLIRPVAGLPVSNGTLLRFAVNTADGFVIAWQRSAEFASPIPYWSTHALTVQRFSTVACLLYGSDPQRFAALPGLVQMPLARTHSCPREYDKAAYAVDWLFATYARKADDPRGEEIDIRFEQPPSRTSQRLLEAIQDRGLVQTTIERLEDFFRLDAPASFVMRSCGQPQAAWLPESRELVFCFELLDAYALLSNARQRRPIEAILVE